MIDRRSWLKLVGAGVLGTLGIETGSAHAEPARRGVLVCIFQRGADRLVIREIQHYKRDWMREARVRKSLTPWTS